MDFLMLIIKSIGSLFALFILTNLLGKKQINQLNMFDYVIGISIGNVVAEMTVNKEVIFFDGIIVMTIYSLLSLFVSFITIRSIKIRKLISGTPIVLMEKGKINKYNLKKAKLDINELLEESRISGYFDLSELDYAIMETNGKISFLPKPIYDNVTKDDLKLRPAYKGPCIELVVDGVIINNNLKKINKDKSWLIKRLNNMNYKDIKKILLVIIDSNEKITVFENNK